MADERPPAAGLDSCILIELFDERSTKRQDIRQILNDAEGGEFTLVISTLVHAEVAASPSRATPQQIWDIRRALSQSYFEPIELSVPLGLLASDLAREFGLKPSDAVHAATCVYKGVPWLLTLDDRVLKAHGKIIMSASDRSKTLNIVTPEDFCQRFYRPLFNQGEDSPAL